MGELDQINHILSDPKLADLLALSCRARQDERRHTTRFYDFIPLMLLASTYVEHENLIDVMQVLG